MRKASTLVVALGFALSGVAYAGSTESTKGSLAGPVQMTEAEMDLVTAAGHHGGLISVDVNRVLNNNNVDVDVPVNIRDVNVGVAAGVAVLGVAGGAVGQR